MIRFLTDRWARLFSSRGRDAETPAAAHWARRADIGHAAANGDDDDDGLAETRLISDPTAHGAIVPPPLVDDANGRRLSWPARDAVPGLRRAAPDDMSRPVPTSAPASSPAPAPAPAPAPLAARSEADDATRFVGTRTPRRPSVVSDDATVLLPPGRVPRNDEATVLVGARKRPGA